MDYFEFITSFENSAFFYALRIIVGYLEIIFIVRTILKIRKIEKILFQQNQEPASPKDKM